MTFPETAAAVLYADISGSMALYQELGDAGAVEMVQILFEELRTCVHEEEGRVVKHLGDGLLCSFPSAERAALASIAMQRHVSAAVAKPPVSVHIGFHWGPVIVKGDDLFGHTVNLAARVADQSRPDRILTTRACCEMLPRGLRLLSFPFRTAAVKGVEETLELYELVWRSDRTAVNELVPAPALPQGAGPARVRLSIEDREYVLEPGGAPLTIGRNAANRLIIPDQRVSSGHARIELRGGAFVLTDTSRNGTYVAFDGTAEFFKTGRELLLRRSGRLWFGRAPDDPEAVCVRFFVE